MEWFTDKKLLVDNHSYIVAAIANKVSDKGTYLYNFKSMTGWQASVLLQDCYAFLPMPKWKGLPNEYHI